MRIDIAAARGFLIGLLALGLSGCAAVVVTGTGTAVAVIHDRRTAGTVVEDQEIQWRAMAMRRDDRELVERSNVNIDVFNMQVLLTGQSRPQ